jgi:phage head maturation protease
MREGTIRPRSRSTAPSPTASSRTSWSSSRSASDVDDENPDRLLAGYLVCWGGPVLTSDRSGRAFWASLDPRCADRWLDEVDPRSMPLRVDHSGPERGRWLAFEADGTGLRGVAVVSDGWAGDRLLEAVDSGELRCFSSAFGIRQGRDRTPVGSDVAVWDVTELEGVAEAGPAHDAADPRCSIVSIAGRLPAWQEVEQARERHERLREHLRVRVPSVAHA